MKPGVSTIKTMHFLQDILLIMLLAKTDGTKDMKKLNGFKNLTMICLENRLLYSLMKYFLTLLITVLSLWISKNHNSLVKRR